MSRVVWRTSRGILLCHRHLWVRVVDHSMSIIASSIARTTPAVLAAAVAVVAAVVTVVTTTLTAVMQHGTTALLPRQPSTPHEEIVQRSRVRSLLARPFLTHAGRLPHLPRTSFQRFVTLVRATHRPWLTMRMIIVTAAPLCLWSPLPLSVRRLPARTLRLRLHHLVASRNRRSRASPPQL